MSTAINTVDVVGDAALTGTIIDRSITELVDSNIETVGEYAFFKCEKLEKVRLENATEIQDNAFNTCKALKRVDLPACKSGYSTREGLCFSNCGPVYLNMPALPHIYHDNKIFKGGYNIRVLDTADLRSITAYQSSTMRPLGNLGKLEALILRWTGGVCNASTYSLSGTGIASGTGYIYVPSALVDSYKTASYWSNYADQIRAIEDYPNVCNKYSWEGVFAAIDAGTYATDYAIGDTIPLDLGSEGVVNMQIAAFDADDLADGSGKAPISWISKELLANNRTFKQTSSEYVNWETSYLREYLNETVQSYLPAVVQGRIKTVTKTHTAYGVSGNQVTSDNMWVPSVEECFGSSSLYFTLFQNQNSNRIKIRTGKTSAENWWLRSLGNAGYTYAYIVSNTGTQSQIYGTTLCGIALGFCT